MGWSHAKEVDPDMNRHALRSKETRARMIEAAIEVFGSVGYEAASTRVLAKRAGVNLAAIPYHFGGKRELYLAAAQAIADYARQRLDPIVAELQDAKKADPVTRIDAAVSSFFHLVVGGTEPKAWLDFVVRCENDVDDAFRIIHEEVFSRLERALREAVADAIGRDATDEVVRMRVAVVLASIVSFRVLPNTTLSILGWARPNPSRLDRLDRTVREFARAGLLLSPTARRPAKQRSETPKRAASHQGRRISVRGNHRKD